MTPAIRARGVRKWYASPDGGRTDAVYVDALELARGERAALVGPSGSGKSTLLHIVSGVIVPSAGEVAVLGMPMHSATEAERDQVRGRQIGIVFQAFHLLGNFSALENVRLATMMADVTGGVGSPERRARELLGRLGLGDRLHHRPHQLSAGQRQRVAIARAVVNRPGLVLADEPTAHVDSDGAVLALDLLEEVCAEVGAALLVATHDPVVRARFRRVIEIVRPPVHLRRHHRNAGAPVAHAGPP